MRAQARWGSYAMRHYTLELEIHTTPPLLANPMIYGHWSKAKRERDRWRNLVAAYTVGRRPSKPLPRARICAVRLSSRQPDPDCQGTGFKWVLDALVSLGVLENDTAKHITFDCSWEYARGKEQGIRLTVEEL